MAGDSAPDRQFDFWVGEWRVETPDGKFAGQSSITRELGGCALREQWTGASGMRGTSINFFDAARAVWHQTWVDTDGLLLVIEGKLHDGAMVLSGVRREGEKDIYERITWSPLPQGRVEQRWERSGDAGATWSVLFVGIYIPR